MRTRKLSLVGAAVLTAALAAALAVAGPASASSHGGGGHKPTPTPTPTPPPPPPPKPSISISPASLDFGSVSNILTLQQAPTQTVTVTNTGSSPETISYVYGLVVSSDCAGVTLAPGASCTALVGFLPNDLGPQHELFEVVVGSTAFTIPVTGTGVGVDFMQNFYIFDNGGTLTGEVQLVQTAFTDQVVDISPSGSPDVSWPTQVVVPAGSYEATFPITVTGAFPAAGLNGVFAISDGDPYPNDVVEDVYVVDS